MIKDAALVSVYGPRGSGKSTLTRALIEGRRTVVAFDAIGDYGELRGWVPVHLTADPGINRKRLGAAAKKAIGNKKFRLAVIPLAGSETANLHDLCMFLFDLQAGYRAGRFKEKLTLVIEEMDLSFPVHNLPADQGGMARLCNQGRHWGLEAIGVTQFPQQISKKFRNNAVYTYAFRLPDTPRRAVEENMMDADKGRLRALAQYEFLEISIQGVKQGRTLKSGKISIK
jgi:hypothetical protein